MAESVLVLGFPDERLLVEHIATELEGSSQLASSHQFSAGEWHIIGPHKAPENVVIATNIRAEPTSLLRACLLSHSARAHGARKVHLISPWVAYGRQDRITTPGEAPAGLLVANWLRDAFDSIYTLDAHSERFIDAFGGKLQNIHASPSLAPSLKDATLIVAPDEGAAKRAAHAASDLGLPLCVFKKTRSETGIHTIPIEEIPWSEHTPLLVDDMTDSGTTLLNAARVLKERGSSRIFAFVPHLLRRSALPFLEEPVINVVETVFDHEADIYTLNQLSLLTQAFRRSNQTRLA